MFDSILGIEKKSELIRQVKLNDKDIDNSFLNVRYQKGLC